MTDPQSPRLVFVRERETDPAIEVWVNFGVYSGRTVTRAEIDRLAEWLLDLVDSVTIVSEDRHEIGAGAEASVHQVRIDIGAGSAPGDLEARTELERRIVERADHWARSCIADRPGVSPGI